MKREKKITPSVFAGFFPKNMRQSIGRVLFGEGRAVYPLSILHDFMPSSNLCVFMDMFLDKK